MKPVQGNRMNAVVAACKKQTFPSFPPVGLTARRPGVFARGQKFFIHSAETTQPVGSVGYLERNPAPIPLALSLRSQNLLCQSGRSASNPTTLRAFLL
ncbi:MAG: hypothetical protein LBR88_00970, partial [Zoogloeaceae bacterium]|nr:hypothetical protein [Zoogloeaceae bacterium]